MMSLGRLIYCNKLKLKSMDLCLQHSGEDPVLEVSIKYDIRSIVSIISLSFSVQTRVNGQVGQLDKTMTSLL